MNPILEGLFFPRSCVACRKILYQNQLFFCSYCEYHLPFTHFSPIPENDMERIFWGQHQIISGTSLLYFHKGSPVQDLIHLLKYSKEKEAGYFLGRLMGVDLKQSQRFDNYDAIIPVPLHPEKQKSRGFNQSFILSEPISHILDIPIQENVLIRDKESISQTTKDRTERLSNTVNPFSITNNDLLINKKVLLIDDILTTGSTLSSCCSAIQKIPGIQIGFATAGWAALD